MRNWLKRYFPVLLFGLGVLSGLTLGGLLVWADIEASLFNPTVVANEGLDTLRCPLLMTPADGETAVTAGYTNPSRENPSRLVARAHVSAGMVTLIRESEEIVQLEPDESVEFSWPLRAADVVFGRFILVRVTNLRNAQIPAMTAACGVVFLNNTLLTGGQILALTLAGSLLLMGVGFGVWQRKLSAAAAANSRVRPAMSITFMLVISLWITGIMGWWLIGVGALVAVLIWAIALMDPISRD